jgi:cytochrome c5
MERKDVMRQKHLAISVLMLGAIFTPVLATLQAQPQDGSQTAAKAGKKQAVAGKPQQANKPKQSDEDDGQRVFEQNCSRCHNAPEGFSPRISGTIVRHMRVRANLSKEDEQKLLRFFNP